MQEGDLVIVTNPDGTVGNYLQKKEIPLKIVWNSIRGVQAESYSENNTSIFNIFLSKKNIQLVKEADIPRYKKNAQKFNNYIQGLKKRAVTNLLAKSLNKNVSKNRYLDTCVNYVELGDIINNEFINRCTNYAISCCSFTKTKYSLKVYIPKVYTDYWGYSEQDVQNWLAFIAGIPELNFEYQFNGLVDLPQKFESIAKSFKKNGTVINDLRVQIRTETGFGKMQFSPSIYLIDKDFYSVTVQGNQHLILTYVKFILVRYIYNNNYWKIPETAMQIKAALGDTVTNWECILMAHCRESMYNGYCLTYNLSSGIANPFTPINEQITKWTAQELTNVNSSFVYLKEIDYKKLKSLFKVNDYKGLYDYLKTIKA